MSRTIRSDSMNKIDCIDLQAVYKAEEAVESLATKVDTGVSMTASTAASTLDNSDEDTDDEGFLDNTENPFSNS